MARWTKLFEFPVLPDGPTPAEEIQGTVNSWLKAHRVKAVSMTLHEGKLSLPIKDTNPTQYANGIMTVLVYDAKKAVKEKPTKKKKSKDKKE